MSKFNRVKEWLKAATGGNTGKPVDDRVLEMVHQLTGNTPTDVDPAVVVERLKKIPFTYGAQPVGPQAPSTPSSKQRYPGKFINEITGP